MMAGVLSGGLRRSSRVRGALRGFCLLLCLCCSTGTEHAQQSGAATAQQHLQRAHAFLAQRKPKEAAGEFKAVLALDPDNADATGNLGVLLYFAQDYRAAEPLLQKTVAGAAYPQAEGAARSV